MSDDRIITQELLCPYDDDSGARYKVIIARGPNDSQYDIAVEIHDCNNFVSISKADWPMIGEAIEAGLEFAKKRTG